VIADSLVRGREKKNRIDEKGAGDAGWKKGSRRGSVEAENQSAFIKTTGKLAAQH
jgi:hypothetical protein